MSLKTIKVISVKVKIKTKKKRRQAVKVKTLAKFRLMKLLRKNKFFYSYSVLTQELT